MGQSSMLSAPTDYLYSLAKKLYDKVWFLRSYSGSGWIIGVSDEEIAEFGRIYQSVLLELRQQPDIEERPLTNKKINQTIDQFPEFNESDFIVNHFGNSMWHMIISVILFPYFIYLQYKAIRKTSRFKRFLKEIMVQSQIISNTYNTTNHEAWMELQESNGLKN